MPETTAPFEKNGVEDSGVEKRKRGDVRKKQAGT